MLTRILLSTRFSRNVLTNQLLPKSINSNTGGFSYATASNSGILTVALVGRPNVGKSTLFNRLTQTKLAIVSSVSGTTRDRNIGNGSLAGLQFQVVDTGGLDDRGHVHDNIQKQVEYAIVTSDVILFIVDSKEGITSLDKHFANWIRRRTQLQSTSTNNKLDGSVTPTLKREVILLANKTEGAHLSDRVLDTISDALMLGLGEPHLISASHGDGMSDLAQLLIESAKRRGYDVGESASRHVRGTSRDTTPVEDRTVQMVVMGKPNVGKSSFINAILGEERVIVGPTPGLTRDAVQTEWLYKKRKFCLVDTAGLLKITPQKDFLDNKEEKKRMRAFEATGKFNTSLPGVQLVSPEEDPSQFSSQVSELALVSALNALRYAQVVVLMVEGGQGKFAKIDLQIARRCLTEGRALVIAANKSDLVEKKGVSVTEYEEGVKRHSDALMREMGVVRVVACAAINRQGVEKVLDAVLATHDAWSRRLSTWVLNKWLKDVLVTIPTPRAASRAIKVKYITQIKARPPTFALFCNTISIPIPFHRFLRSRIQHDLGLQGVPVRFIIRKTKGKETDSNLLLRSSSKRQSRRVNSGRPVGPKREGKNRFLAVRKLRANRLVRRKAHKRKAKLGTR